MARANLNRVKRSNEVAEMSLREDQLKRYARQLVIDEIGDEGQEKLLGARVLVVGAGGLGSPLLYYLAAAGVGTIGIADGDFVDISNLQRQIIHGTDDIGRPKVESAADKIRKLNPDVNVELHGERITADKAVDIISRYDVAADASDNFATKFLMNDAAYLAGKPLSIAGISGFDGQALTVVPGRGPCYRCLFRNPPPPGSVPVSLEAGVVGTSPGIIGAVQANEVIKIIIEKGELLCGRFLVFDGLRTRFDIIEVERDPSCPLCGDNPGIKIPGDSGVRDE